MWFKRLLPVFLGAVLGPLGGNGIITLVPVLAQVWSLDLTVIALSITLYMLPFIVAQIFSGSIAHIFDVRKTVLSGFAAYTAGALISAFSSDFGLFMVGRVIQGCGGAFLAPILMAMVGDMVDARHLGKAMGGLGVAYTVGVTMGPLISGILDVYIGWRGFFFFLAGFSVLTAVLFFAWCRDLGEPGENGSVREIFPLVRRALLHPGILKLSFAAFSYFFGYIGLMTFTGDYMKTLLQLPSDRVGLMLSMAGFSGIVVAPLAGFFGDRYGKRPVLVTGMVVSLTLVALMFFKDFNYGLYLIIFFLLGVGSASSWTSLNTMAVQASVELRNPVTSIYNVIKFSGYAAAPVALSFVYGDGNLKAVQIACAGVLAISAYLALKKG